MKRGFSVTTAILVVLLLGVLVMVGKVVNPPPAKDEHDHSEEQAQSQPAAKPVSKEDMKKQQMDKMKMMQEQMKSHQPPASAKGKTAPKKDLLDASAWQEHDMGAVTPKAEPSTVVPVPTAKPSVSTETPRTDTKP